MIYYAKAGTPLPMGEQGVAWDCWYRANGSMVEVWVSSDYYFGTNRETWKPAYQFKTPKDLHAFGLPMVDKEGNTFNSIYSLDEGL